MIVGTISTHYQILKQQFKVELVHIFISSQPKSRVAIRSEDILLILEGVEYNKKTFNIFVNQYNKLKGSVHTWNKVGQIYLGCKKKYILLIHFGEMFINY